LAMGNESGCFGWEVSRVIDHAGRPATGHDKADTCQCDVVLPLTCIVPNADGDAGLGDCGARQLGVRQKELRAAVHAGEDERHV
jgi:hypothetical protein